jgi:hypothetical protein
MTHLPPPDRRARLAEQLRANLKRRKMQARHKITRVKTQPGSDTLSSPHADLEGNPINRQSKMT